MERGRKHPQFYHVREVVEVRWHTPFQEIPIKTTRKKKEKKKTKKGCDEKDSTESFHCSRR